MQVYTFAVDESFANESVGVFLGRAEEHSRSYLAIGPHPHHPGKHAAVLVGNDDTAPAIRELFESADGRELGPGAPDLACRQRTWDPLEDALALAWPKLPAGPVRRGDAWLGQRVGGRCHETPCLDSEGHFDPNRSCQTRPWREQLAGWVQTDAGRLAVVRSSWDDGHEREPAAGSEVSESTHPEHLGRESSESTHPDHPGREFGILTSRELAILGGRPVFAQAEVWHRWIGVLRRLELRAIDDCSPGLRPPTSDEAAATLARVRASLR